MSQLMTLPDDGRRREKLSALYAECSHVGQKDKLYADMRDRKGEVMPGPGHFFGPDSRCFSSFGKIVTSQVASAPEITLPKTAWDSWEGVKITNSHMNKALKGAEKLLSAGDYSFNLCTLSKKGISVSKDKRFKKKGFVTASPGPIYDIREHHAKDVTTNIPGCKASRFSHANRFLKNLGELNVAPGQYERKDTGIRIDFATAPGFGVDRKAYSKIVRPGWEEDRYATAGYGVGPPLWTELVREGVAMTIPKAARFPKVKISKSAPGPGHYPRTERDVSKLGSRISDVRNPMTCKFGKPDKQPRLKMEVLQRCEPGCWGYF